MVLSNFSLLILVSVVEELPEKVPRFFFCFATGTCVCTCECVFLCVYFYTLCTKKKTWIILAVSFQSSFSSRGAAWETFSLENVHFKTTKANENREAEWKPLCKFHYSNCYQSFSIHLLSNFSTDIMNKTPTDNSVCFLVSVVGFCRHQCVNAAC